MYFANTRDWLTWLHDIFRGKARSFFFLATAVICFWWSNYCSGTVAPFCHYSNTGKRLNTTVYRKVYSLSKLDCVSLCVLDGCCRAINHETYKYFEKNCEMLHEIETDLMPAESYSYAKLIKPNREFDCRCSSCHNGGTCNKETKQCLCTRDFHGLQCKKAKFKNCNDIVANSDSVRMDGIYAVDPDGQGFFYVRCDRTTDHGLGWTVFQRRVDGNQDFYQNWSSYQEGFGDLNGEFWLGLNNIHRLTKSGLNILRVDLGDFENETAFAKYEYFHIGSEVEKYRLTINGFFEGSAGDSLTTRHNGMMFGTKDKPNDGCLLPQGYIGKCAQKFHGAWWYECCHESNLNGPYVQGEHLEAGYGMNWRTFRGYHYSVKTTEMKIV